MQASTDVSADALGDALHNFFACVMHGDQGDLFAIIAELDLTLAQIRGLMVLNASDRALALTELAPRMGLSVAAAGRAVDGLVRKGLLSRSEDPEDRRIKRLAVTPAGGEAIARIAGARREGFRRFAATLGERERAVLAEALAAVQQSQPSKGCERG